MDRLREPFRFAASWALGASAATALVDALARALCLPPHWRAELVLDCRSGGWLAAIPRALLDAGITTVLFFPFALLIGAATWGVARFAADRLSDGAALVAAGLVGLLLWGLAVRWMEPSYLDFIVSGYAVLAGAVAGAALAGVARRAVLAL